MSIVGRQYPDGPLVPPPGAKSGRLPDLEGWPDSSLNYWPEAAGEFLHNILNPEPQPEPQPGPPYVHTLVPPEPIGEDDDGNPVYPEPGPALTVLRSEAEQASSSLPDGAYWIES